MPLHVGKGNADLEPGVNVFERFIKQSSCLKRHREGPMATERDRYLRHLADEGRNVKTLKDINGHIFRAAELLDLKDGQLVTSAGLQLLGERWLDEPPRARRRTDSRHRAKTLFIGRITDWLRFIGRLEKECQIGPYDTVTDQFIDFSRSERGLAEPTLKSFRRTAQAFFCWYALKVGRKLNRLNANHLSVYVQEAPFSGWSRVSISGQISNLRVLLRWLGNRGLCSPRLSDCIRAPRIYTHEQYPVGPTWNQVQQLVGSAGGTAVQDLRDRAILLLLSVYSFRSGEVSRLCLDDIDWENETIRPARPKQRRVSVYPLTRNIGEAIIAYLQVRPSCRYRNVFLSLRQPYRPLSHMGNVVHSRQKRLGQKLKRYGPHGLRHACATYLLAEGFTLKQIGDHLGHTMIRATEAYAKVDLVSLRQVGEFAMPMLIACDADCAARETPFYIVGELEGLHAVADLSLKEII
jgi:site-specific recombinase XerD